jgi:putative ABC transport system permease protein
MRQAGQLGFWRWILLAYPAEFRAEYGPEMVQALHERCRGEQGASRIWFCIDAVRDVIATAIRERYRIMIRDLSHSLRRLLGHPGIAAVAVLSLALGIGANTTMFSIVYASLLRPLPYPDSDRRQVIFTTALNSPDKGNRNVATSADFMDWRTQSKNFEDWHMFTGRGATTVTGGDLPERITTTSVTPGLLESFGVRPVIGRFFRPGEEAEHPALIGEGYWRRRFGEQPDVIGRKLTTNGVVHTIVGVVPDFEMLYQPDSADFWNTIDLSPGSIWVQRSVPWIWATAKLKQGVSLQQGQTELAAIAANLAQAYPATNRYRGVVVTPMLEARNGRMGATLYALFGAVGFVLLIACTNVANLLLARATARRREISVRAALGAGRDRLIREFLADGVVLAVPGIAAGIAIAYAGTTLFRRAFAPQGFPGANAVDLNLQVLCFTAAAGGLAGILAALFPALEGSKADVTEALKEGGRGSAGRRRQRLRSLLVAGEIALALILLVGAGLTINSVWRLQNHSLGFDSDNITVAQLDLTGKRYMTDAPKREIDMRNVEPAVARFIEHVLREVRALPGVESAALAGNVPMGPISGPNVRVRAAGSSDSEEDLRRAEFNVITSGFFETLRIPLRRGRYLNDGDAEGTAWVAVVNEAFAREFFPGGEALGQVVKLSAGPDERPREIVGVVADYIQHTPRMRVQPEVYTSHSQQIREIPGNFQGQRFRSKLVVRTHFEGAVKPDAFSKIAADFDKELAVFGVRPLAEYITLRSGSLRFYANALAIFSAIALVLATIGIYGLMNYSVTDRFHEIGIRLSLGASRRQVIWLIVSYGLKLAGAGLVAGIVGSLAATRVIESLLFEVRPWDPVTFTLVSGFLLAVAIAACAIPAMRATVIDPVVALREE